MAEALETRKVMIGALEVDVLAGRYYTPEDTEGNRAAIHPETNTDVVYDPITGKNLTTLLTEVGSAATTGATEKADAALDAAKDYTDEKITALVGTAPDVLDTLGEIAEALKGDATVVSALETQIASKAGATETTNALALKADKSATYTKAEVDTALGLKANSSDVNSGLAGKADKSSVYTKSEMDTSLATKADANATATALGTKADATETTNALALKATTASVTALENKVNAAPQLIVGTVPFAEATGLKAQDFYIQIL